MKKISLFFLLIATLSYSKESIFDKVHWIKVEEKNSISLFMQKEKNSGTNYYKAEKTLNNCDSEAFFNSLLDFVNYPKIFPRTEVFDKIKKIDKNCFIIYSVINFSPLKNRDYFIILEYDIEKKSENSKKYIVQWRPLPNDEEKDLICTDKDYVRAKKVFGRWTVEEINNYTKISVEYYNDFNLNFSPLFTTPLEKKSTIEALNNLINYTLQSKKYN